MSVPGGSPGLGIPSFIRDIPDPEKPFGNPASIKDTVGSCTRRPFWKDVGPRGGGQRGNQRKVCMVVLQALTLFNTKTIDIHFVALFKTSVHFPRALLSKTAHEDRTSSKFNPCSKL